MNVGAVRPLSVLEFNLSIAVWVGLIALVGVDAETGVFMFLYLDFAYYERRAKGRMKTREDLREAVVQGAVKRLRPKFMAVAVMFLGLVPILWSTGAGSDVMKRIAAPMFGGIFTPFPMELAVYPAIYEVRRGYFHVRPDGRKAEEIGLGKGGSCPQDQLRPCTKTGFHETDDRVDDGFVCGGFSCRFLGSWGEGPGGSSPGRLPRHELPRQ